MGQLKLTDLSTNVCLLLPPPPPPPPAGQVPHRQGKGLEIGEATSSTGNSSHFPSSAPWPVPEGQSSEPTGPIYTRFGVTPGLGRTTLPLSNYVLGRVIPPLLCRMRVSTSEVSPGMHKASGSELAQSRCWGINGALVTLFLGVLPAPECLLVRVRSLGRGLGEGASDCFQNRKGSSVQQRGTSC